MLTALWTLVVFFSVTYIVSVALLFSYSVSVLGVAVVVISFPLLRKRYGVTTYHDAAIKLDELFPIGTKIELMEALLCSKVGKLFDNTVIASAFRDDNSIVSFFAKKLRPIFRWFGNMLKRSSLCRYPDICNLASLFCGEISYSNVCDPWFGEASDFQLDPRNEKQNAFVLSLAAKLAYEEDAVITKVATGWGWTVKANINDMKEGTQAFIIAKDDNLVVSFRGTEGFNFIDWATDFSLSTIALKLPMLSGLVPDRMRASAEHASTDLVQVNHTKIDVHRGFYDAMKPVYQQISQAIEAQVSTRKQTKVWVTGHSLGAALASVFVMEAIRTRSSWLKKHFGGLYTYGQPRCGDQGYVDVFDKYVKNNQVHRIVLANDLVPRVPVVWKAEHPDYVHHGVLTYITSQFDLERPSQPEQYDRVRLLPGIWENFQKTFQPNETGLRKLLRVALPFSVNDHLPFDYVRALQAAIKKSK